MVPRKHADRELCRRSIVPRRHVFLSRNSILISDERVNWARHRRLWRAVIAGNGAGGSQCGNTPTRNSLCAKKSGFAPVIWAAKSHMSLCEKPWICLYRYDLGRSRPTERGQRRDVFPIGISTLLRNPIIRPCCDQRTRPDRRSESIASSSQRYRRRGAGILASGGRPYPSRCPGYRTAIRFTLAENSRENGT